MADSFDARDFLSRLRARHGALRLDGNRLVLSGGDLTDSDRETVRTHAAALAAALRQPEPHAEAPAQPETHPGLPAVPTAPETPSLLERFEAQERERLRSFRGRPITPAEVRQCLLSSGDWDAYRAGTLSADDAYEMTRTWLRNSTVVNTFVHNLFND